MSTANGRETFSYGMKIRISYNLLGHGTSGQKMRTLHNIVDD